MSAIDFLCQEWDYCYSATSTVYLSPGTFDEIRKKLDDAGHLKTEKFSDGSEMLRLSRIDLMRERA